MNIFDCYISIVGRPYPPKITCIYKSNPPYHFSDSDNYKNGTTIPVEVTDKIKITSSVSCTKPAVNLKCVGPGEISNNKVKPCADSWTFTSESELRIDRATKDDTGLISLHYSHPLLTKRYEYYLQVNGKYMMLQD